MILDELRNASLYRSISPRLAQALDFLQKADFARLEIELLDAQP